MQTASRADILSSRSSELYNLRMKKWGIEYIISVLKERYLDSASRVQDLEEEVRFLDAEIGRAETALRDIRAEINFAQRRQASSEPGIAAVAQSA